jgi:quinoprotein glucose dehydrogenase
MTFRTLLLFSPLALSAATPETHPESGGLVRSLFAKEPMFINPVALSVDTDGTVYVTEAARRKVADPDIREMMQWVVDDLSHTSIEEKRDFFRKSFTTEPLKKSSIKDHDKNGKVDWKDLTKISEKVHKLVDTDGDGIADKATVFAEDFNTEITGTAAGVFARNGDVYATIAPDFWKLKDTNGDGKADARKAIVTGFAPHMSYSGHDMHGPMLGPDGMIYWTIGDKGVNVLSEGTRWFYPYDGALMRCRPDGSGFEVYARGLRNVQQVAFDDYGNFFGVDNDSDAAGEKERFVYIAEGSDSGWRSYYQYRGTKYNPWMAERLAFPDGPDQPAYITPPIQNYVDGPSGFAFNPGTALSPRFKGCFFVTQFPSGKINAFKVEENGASYKMVDDQRIATGTAYVGCNFGPDGALYVADWQGGYPLKEKGAVWKLDDPKEAGSAMRKEVAGFIKSGPSKVPDTDLAKRLGHADQRVRLDAQWELASRKKWDLLTTIAKNNAAPQLARIHALWGLSQGKEFDEALFTVLATDKDSEIRAQAAKWVGECGKPADLAKLLTDSNMRVRFHAAMAVGKNGDKTQLPGVVTMLEKEGGRDACIRHAGAFALSRTASISFVEKMGGSLMPWVRKVAIVAMRDKLQNHARKLPSKAEPGLDMPLEYGKCIARFLDDTDPAVVAEAARALYEDPFTNLPDLATLLEKKTEARESAIRRSISANRRVGDDASLLRLATYATSKAPAPLRQVALDALASVKATDPLDSVDGRYAPLKALVVSPGVANKISTLLKPLESDSALSKSVSAALDALGAKQDPAALTQQALDAKLDPAQRISALQHLKNSKDPKWTETAVAMLKQNLPALRSGVAPLLGEEKPEFALSYVSNIGLKSTDLGERQSAVRLLGTLAAKPALTALLADLSSGKLDPAIQLELLESAALLKLDELHEVETKLAAANPLGKWSYALAGGNSEAGRKIFEGNLAANCTACHRMGAEGSNVGPALNQAGKKGRDYILESLILPQAKIAPGFGTATVTKKDGSVIAGAPKGETADALTLLLPDGKETVIKKSDIASQTPAISVMPPMGEILKPAELRDLVEYLGTRQ